MNLILLERSEVDEAGSASITGARAKHVASVLRATPGQTIRVGLLDGPVGTAEIVSIDAHTVSMRCSFGIDIPARPPIDLLLALPRPKVMNRLWAQLSALGVGRIMLTNAEKVERPYFDTHVLDEAHYRPLLIEGLQQAKDTRLPLVSIHRQFRVFVEDELDALSPDAVRFVADARASTPMQAAPDVRVLLAVGPEGGWNSFELNLLLGHRFTPISLGARTLRSDTACIALLTLAHAALRGR